MSLGNNIFNPAQDRGKDCIESPSPDPTFVGSNRVVVVVFITEYYKFKQIIKYDMYRPGKRQKLSTK